MFTISLLCPISPLSEKGDGEVAPFKLMHCVVLLWKKKALALNFQGLHTVHWTINNKSHL